MLSFSDEELDTISELAAPIPQEIRADFLQLVAGLIEGYSEQSRGPGLVHRIAAEAQRDFLKVGEVAVGRSRRTVL
jgi:hypothetical protein